MEIVENKIAAVVILYHSKEDVIKNILSYSDHCEKLYLFDNSPDASSFQQQLEQIKGVNYFHDGENRGIAERLNEGCRKALEDGYEWVLTMDQDTFFSAESIAAYFQCFSNYETKHTVGAFCTRYGRENIASSPVCKAEKSDDVITSGMLLNLKSWQQVDGFDEALFIDSVDQEFCLKAEMAGFKIFCFSNIYIQHEIGIHVYRSSIKTLFLKRKSKVIHSPLRCYYIYRNMLYLEKKYQKTNPAFTKNLRSIVETHLQVCLLYGYQRIKTFRYLLIARNDFQNKQMGRIANDKIIQD